ncbi:MAG TPA: hypothetical protein VGB79_07895 [Allosphingosinicella sp.]
MKRIWPALALAACGSAAGAQQRAGEMPRGAQLAGLVAAEAQSRTPLEMSPGTQMIAARAQGNMLVWVLQVPASDFNDARNHLSLARDSFRTGFCRTESRILFERGVTLQVEVTDGSRPALRFPLITDCPPAE